jgi:rubrerythrin
MTRDEILNQLEKLIQLDVDATHAYDQAIKNVDEQVIKDKLLLFQGDHRRHIDLLSAKVLELGGTPPELSSDFKGFFISGFTALRSLTGTKGALEAMETNEKLTTSKYQDAAKLVWPTDISSLIQSNLADEQRHLSFVREAIATLVSSKKRI